MKNKSTSNKLFNKHSSVLFATFAVYIKGKRLPTNGMIEPMLSFFLPKVHQFLLLIQPHPSSDRISPIIESYKNNQREKDTIISPIFYFPLYLVCKMQNSDNTHVSFKLRDLFSVLFVGLTHSGKFDFFIGLESVNAIAGIILKKIGKVKTVVYYVSDYSPGRFRNNVFNKLYLWLDTFCVEHADFTWDVSPAMKEGRLALGVLRCDLDKIIHVPNGLFESQINPIPISKRIPDSIVYMGLLNLDQQGVDLALQAFKIILKKKPSATFHVIGGTNRQSKPFFKMIKDLGIEKSVIIHGFIPPNKRMSNVINRCWIGVATYRSDRNPRNRYGDSGKIKQYLGCGLPIVATTIQWYTQYVIDKGAGIGVEETPEDFAKGILSLFDDKQLYKRCSKKALELSKDNTWENSYSKAFFEMGRLDNKK